MRCPLLALVGLSVGITAGASLAGDFTASRVVALLPIQDRVGDRGAAAAVEQALSQALEKRVQVLDRDRTRSVMRRMRLRDVDAAPSDSLRGLAEELGADWLVSATVRDAERRDAPRLTVSARVYRGSTGELSWVGFEGGSGLDGRGVLGLGVIPELETLVPRVVGRLELELERKPSQSGDSNVHSRRRSGTVLGRVVVVPFAGLTPHRPTANAETVTEAARAALLAAGVSLVSPGCANEALGRRRFLRWGGVDAETRRLLRDVCNADSILTGSVERYDVAGAEMEPEPRVALALRLLEAGTGRILWTGASERRGWDHQALFRLGRVHSRGVLTEAMMRSLIRRLVREQTHQLRRGEATP